jgi:flavodoxin
MGRKTLVVCFSRSGHTRQVAQEIALRHGADLEIITEPGDRIGTRGYLRCVWESLTGASPPIHAAKRDPAAYDLVIVGTPIWAFGLASPVRSYVRRYAHAFRRVAFFCTEGGAGERRAFDELRRLCRKEPVATLVVTEAELSPEASHAEQLNRFVAGLASG